MSRASFVLLVAIAVLFSLCTATSQPRCGPNEMWTACGSACPPSCNSPPLQDCTKNCIIGCQCKQGYLLNSAGACVTPESC